MKKLIFTLSLFCMIAVQSNAQYCGGSGPSVCQPANLTKPGLAPVSDSLPPVIDDVPTATTIHFENFDTIRQGTLLTMDSLHIDTIGNLPSGLCWRTNKSDNTFNHEENGCIIVTGTTNAPAGQYQLRIIIDAYVGFPLMNTNASVAGLYYYVRVNCSDSAAVQPIDTNGEAEGTIAKFIPYNTQIHCNVGIKNVDDNIQSLTASPNPFNNQTLVKFTSIKAGSMTEKITNIIGSTLYSNTLDVAVGQNAHTINRNNLAAGVYFYTISDGTSTFTQKLVIAE